MKRLLSLSVTMLFYLIMHGQGTTTSSVQGQIAEADGEVLVGVNVIFVHTPTGSTYGTITNLKGNYSIHNMKVGGPYKMTTSYVGYSDTETNEIYLSLGKASSINVAMSEGGVELDVISIVAQTGTTGSNSGAQTQISTESIESMPTLNRNLNDFTRLTPQAKETFGGGFSIAGINNRYNAIYIDGAVNNDVFGLADNGTNGGQTGVSPFSIDIIDQIQVVVSPYDVTLGGFAGGGINAVTKSGTNKFQGSAYYYLQNQGLAGKTNKTLSERAATNLGIDYNDSLRTKLADFSSTLYGLSLGGPIIKDKVFFFVNAEIQKDETPLPFEVGDYRGDVTEGELNSLKDYMMSEYGYDAGDFGNQLDKLDGTKLFGKFDFNINDRNKLSLRHQYTKAEQIDVRGSSSGSINFSNDGVFFPTTTNSSALELNSSIGANASNNLIVGYTTVRDDRDPIGQDFPAIRIRDANGSSIFLGSEAFSTANQLDQNILTITDNFKLYKGDHTITLGTHNEFINVYNLFIRQNFGAYEFNSLDEFYTGIAGRGYDRSYSLVDEVTGDGSNAAADFNVAQFGLYIQDEYAVNNKLSLTGGLRIDMPVIGADPVEDVYFNTTALPEIEKQYDLEGARAGQSPAGQLMLSPRLGFNYDLSENNSTVLRGGIGVFTSRIPLVWPGGAFTNNGLTIGGLNENDIDGDVIFNPDAQSQYTNPNFSVPSGQMDLYAKDFKYPQLLRGSLALDKSFASGWTASIEGIYSKTLNNVDYKNVNSENVVDFNWTNGSGDARPVYTNNSIDPTYTAVYLGTNTSEGYTYSVTGSANKKFNFGLDLMFAYTIGDAYALNEATSSQNSSQWRGTFHVDGRNNPSYGRSDFALGNRIIVGMNYDIDWNKSGNYNTSFSLFYNGESGDSYSYVYDQRNLNGERGSTSRERTLIYVPSSQDDIALVDDGDNTAQMQWDALNTFIEQDAELSQKRGQYAAKNGSRSPFEHVLDFKIAQNLGGNLNGTGHRLQITLDVFNFMNLLNPSWGAVYSNPFNYEILNFEGYAADGTTPQFTFSEDKLEKDRFGISDRASRWRARLGLRYNFN